MRWALALVSVVWVIWQLASVGMKEYSGTSTIKMVACVAQWLERRRNDLMILASGV
jgi:hypothetical protein